jgi:predicted secreted hydrolase
MQRQVRMMAMMAIAIALVATVFSFTAGRERARPPQLVALAAAANGFARAAPGHSLAFPADYGPHNDFQTEWWYYTGNLDSADGRRFGYQLTFFRRAMTPADMRQPRASAWAADQVYMAHFAVANVGDRRFLAFERFARGAAGLAGAQASPYRVWLEDWSVEETAPGVRRLRAAQGDLVLDLVLTARKEPTLQGDRGYSQKGPEPGNASYYYSLA